MAGSSSAVPSESERPSSGPDDDFLIAAVRGGDAAALRKMMDRYDRLVRYTIYRLSKDRCQRDPHWLESIASDTWAGFVRSTQRDPANRPKSVAAYLASIARNQCANAARQAGGRRGTVPLADDDDTVLIPAKTEDPGEFVSRIEDLEALRRCLGELDERGREIVSQLGAITERRWREAAGALGISESTLRSRWKRTVERLRGCLRQKTGKSFAPHGMVDDS